MTREAGFSISLVDNADSPPTDRTTLHTPSTSRTGAVAARHSPALLAASLAKASHPGPVFAVTALTCALAIGAGHSVGRVALITGAVFCGQLSVGWSNDVLDAGRDAYVERTDKPVATGVLTPVAVWSAAVLALLLCVALSLACGPLAGAVHLAGVSAAWAYNLRLKATVLSPLPYLVGFVSLPALVTLSPPSPTWPALWAIAATGLLGVAAHLADALPDLSDDLTTGVRGLPHRLGPVRTGVALLPLLVVATAVLVWGPPGHAPSALVGAPMAAAALATTGLLLARRRPKAPFVAAVTVAAMNIGLLANQGAQLS